MPTPITAVAAHGTSVAAADSAGDLSRATSFGARRRTSAARRERRSRTPPTEHWSPGRATGRSGSGTSPEPVRLSSAAPVRAAISASEARLPRPDGRRDGSRLRARRQADARSGRVQLAALAPDGAVVATAKGREVDLWSATTGRLLHRLVGHTSLVTDVEFSPDGRTLVTASDDHDARLWDASSGRLLHVLRGHFFPVRTASFSPTAIGS